MNGFEKGLSSSKPNANRNLSSSGSMENNENDSSVDKLISQFENHKIVFGKHFISGAPRKKILGEIKEIPSASVAQDHTNPNLDLEKSPPKKGVSDGHASEPKDDSSVKVYDPLTNYLSPRPKYLRFNPNRRREILKRLENEGREELNSSPDSVEVNNEEVSSAEEMDEDDSSLSPPNGGVVNRIDEGLSEEDNDNVVDGYEAEEDEEEEEIEEERGWCLRGVLKLLFAFIACFLSTSYICSMNSPTDSPIQQAKWNIKDSGVVIKNGTLEFVSTVLQDDGFFEVGVGGNYRVIEEVEVDEESHGEVDESFEAEIVEDLERFEREMIGNENEDSKDMVDEAAEFEGIRAAQFEFTVDEYVHWIDAKTDENIDDSGIWLDVEVDSSYMGLEEDNVNKDEAAEMEIIGGGEVDSEPECSGQLIGAKTVESEDASGYVLEIDIDSSNQLQGLELPTESKGAHETGSLEELFGSHGESSNSMDEGLGLLLESFSEEIPTESKGTDETGSLEELVGSQGEFSDSMDEADDAEVGMEKSEWNTPAVVVVSAVVIVLTLLAILHHLKKSRSSTSSKEFEPVQKQNFAVEKNVSQVLPSIERKVEFLSRASLSSHSMREAPRELGHHIHAPTVELIGEIVVGQPSSIGRSGKYQMTISEDECYATLSKKHGSLTQLVSAPSQPSATELHSSTSSSTYGSFTTERKISKKEGGQSREAMLETTTPVRRSSRLRNRSAVMSL